MKNPYNKKTIDRAIGTVCLICGVGVIIFTLLYLFQHIHEADQTRLLKNSHGNVVFGCVVALFGWERFVSEQQKMMLRKISALIIMSIIIQFWL